jgi:hypothetical protein
MATKKKRPTNPWVNQTWGGGAKGQMGPGWGKVTPSSPPPTATPGINPAPPSAPPIDPAFENYKVTASRNVALTDADAVYQNARLDNAYGLGADKSNPYNQANMLMQSYERGQRGASVSYAGMGQLYSGAYRNQQRENQHQYNVGFDQLARNYQDSKYDIARGQLDARAQAGTGYSQAQFDSILNALRGGR